MPLFPGQDRRGHRRLGLMPALVLCAAGAVLCSCTETSQGSGSSLVPSGSSDASPSELGDSLSVSASDSLSGTVDSSTTSSSAPQSSHNSPKAAPTSHTTSAIPTPPPLQPSAKEEVSSVKVKGPNSLEIAISFSCKDDPTNGTWSVTADNRQTGARYGDTPPMSITCDDSPGFVDTTMTLSGGTDTWHTGDTADVTSIFKLGSGTISVNEIVTVQI
jgi:hypothetical protein